MQSWHRLGVGLGIGRRRGHGSGKLEPIYNPLSEDHSSAFLLEQHILVLAVLLCVSHLLLLRSLPPGGLSYTPAQLLASCLFSCGLFTMLQTWMGSR